MPMSHVQCPHCSTWIWAQTTVSLLLPSDPALRGTPWRAEPPPPIVRVFPVVGQGEADGDDSGSPQGDLAAAVSFEPTFAPQPSPAAAQPEPLIAQPEPLAAAESSGPPSDAEGPSPKRPRF